MSTPPERKLELGDNPIISPRQIGPDLSTVRRALALNLSAVEVYLDVDFDNDSADDIKKSLSFVATVLQQAMQKAFILFDAETQLNIVKNLQVKTLKERLESPNAIHKDELKKAREILFSRLLFLKSATTN